VGVEPCLSFRADYSDWKTGNERIIKRWPRIRSTELSFMKHSSKPRKNSKRPLGFYRGEIWMAPDFDAPLMLVADSEAKALTPDKSVAKKEIRKLSRPAKAGLA